MPLPREDVRTRLVGLFLLGLVLFVPPILTLPAGHVLGIPALYLYLFGAWSLLVGALAWVIEWQGRRPPRHEG
jgi:hypothetical protein